MSYDEAEVRQMIADIDDLEGKLFALYARRRAVMTEMDKSMSRRAIGEVFGISNVAVSKAINGKKYALPGRGNRTKVGPDGRPVRRASATKDFESDSQIQSSKEN